MFGNLKDSVVGQAGTSFELQVFQVGEVAHNQHDRLVGNLDSDERATNLIQKTKR